LQADHKGEFVMSLEAEVERVDAETVVVKLTGRMTLGMRLREIESKVTRDVDEGTHKLVLDISGVDYADSSGLGFLMLLHGRVKTKGGQLRLAGPNKSLLDLFKLTGTDSILTIHPNCATALSS
jgi:anti-anti-sigma factor